MAKSNFNRYFGRATASPAVAPEKGNRAQRRIVRGSKRAVRGY